MKNGFYLIGKDNENTNTYCFGIRTDRFDTLKQAEKEKEIQYHENMGLDIDIQILEVD